jgi:hypothetical protein
MQFDKVGFISITAKIYVKKINDGEKGDTGDTGAAGSVGATGPAGPAGVDGTGLVVIRKNIFMTSYTSLTLTADNSDGLRFESTVPHVLNPGDTIYHATFSESTYNGYYKVTEVLDTTHYRIESVAYVSDDAGVGVNKSQLAPRADFDSHYLEWYDIIAEGAALVEIRFVMTSDDDEDEIYSYIGYERYPTVGWNAYMNGELYEEVGDQRPWPATLQPYVVQPLRGSNFASSRQDIYIRLAPYVGKNWDTYYPDVEFTLTVAYINLEVSESAALVQYLPYFEDGTAQGRIGMRNGQYVRDKTLTPTGFSGTEGVDWYNIDSH